MCICKYHTRVAEESTSTMQSKNRLLAAMYPCIKFNGGIQYI